MAADLKTKCGSVPICVGLVLAVLVSQPARAGRALPLTGESLIGAELGTPGTSQLSGTCDPTQNSTFTFRVTGQALGPYPGTFTESGTFTLGPATPSPEFGLLFPPLSFTSSFTIVSGNTTITGTKALAASPLNFGGCGAFAFFGSPPSAANIQVAVTFTARVTTRSDEGDDGAKATCFSGAGSIPYGDTQFRGIPNFQGFAFFEFFDTSVRVRCGGNSDDDDG
jgi:hypothetical protein